MMKSFYLLNALVLCGLALSGQDNTHHAYVLRKHKDQDSCWTVRPICYFVSNAGLKEKRFGWLQLKELQDKGTDLLYVELETDGSIQLALELQPGTTAVNFDTLSRLTYHLINNFYGYARRSLEKRNNTIDILSGSVSFTRADDQTFVIDGNINMDTKNPSTHQEIVFKSYLTSRLTLPEVLAAEQQREEERERRRRQQWAAYEIMGKERKAFYDSVFTEKKYPGNQLIATINHKTKFAFHLSDSYLLKHALVTDSAKRDLSEMLDGNILASVQGNKKVFVLRALYDPVKNTIDDETNYSLTIELDSIIAGKTYEAKEFKAKLAYWHYGPHGTVITSKQTKGKLIITSDNVHTTSGTLALTFKNTDKTTFLLNGTFVLPKIDLSDIADLERRIRDQLMNQLLP